jgi:hypothetical protein
MHCANRARLVPLLLSRRENDAHLVTLAINDAQPCVRGDRLPALLRVASQR